jgi:hypothetical protein
MPKPVPTRLENWDEVRAAFDSFPPPQLSFTVDGDLDRSMWIFRGHKSKEYDLAPRVERDSEGKCCEWPALESMLVTEFQSKARLYMSAADLPAPDDKPSWLALMQHFGIPTRLLDFSYSPYVALYFALRERTEKECLSDAAVWAIDAAAVMGEASPTFWAARRKKEDHEGSRRSHKVSLLSDFNATDRDVYESDFTSWNERLGIAVAPTDIIRGHFNESGYVDVALPSVQNPRLSAQQGLFLVNGAEKFSFEDSLFKMMEKRSGVWCGLFHISADALADIERKLFQTNVHDLSLFPDMEGLAAFIRQKVRLHFAPAVGATAP